MTDAADGKGGFGSKWGRSFSTRNHGSSVQVFACLLQFCEGRMYVRGFLFGTKAMSWAQEPQTVTGQCQRHLKQNAIWGIGMGHRQNAHLLNFGSKHEIVHRQGSPFRDQVRSVPSALVRFEENAAIAVIRCRSPVWRVGLLDQMVIRNI